MRSHNSKNLNALDSSRRLTMVDIARMAEVSVATVSAAFNQGSISPKTYDRVMAVSRRTGYKPNRIARSMVTKKTHILGLVINAVIVELTDSAAASSSHLGYDLMTLFPDKNDPSSEPRCIHRLLERRVDGILIKPAQHEDVDYGQLVAEMRASGTQVVMIDRYFREIKVDSVVTNNYRGALLAVEHLISQGHRRIGLLQSKQQTASSQQDRLRGYRDALQGAGIVFDPDLVVAESKNETVNAAIGNLLKCQPPITAIFSTTDYMAYETMVVCRELGIRIPHDLSLVGFDDFLYGHRRMAELLDPKLTTVRQDFSQIMSYATELLVNKIERKSPRQMDKIHYLEPELIVRESTCPPSIAKR